MSLEELWREIQLCAPTKNRCPYAKVKFKKFSGNPVYNAVPHNVNVMFVAVAPPESDEFFYVPGKGRGMGKRLFSLLRHAGFNVQSISDFKSNGMYLTDALKCPGGDLKECRKFLIKEIELLKPKIIVALGDIPLKALRGVCWKILPTFFPTAPIKNEIKIEHLKLLRKELKKIE